MLANPNKCIEYLINDGICHANMRSLTAAHTLPFNLALFNMSLCHRFANLGLCNCSRPADLLRADILWGGMRLRLCVWISIGWRSVPRDFSPSCAELFRRMGWKLMIFFFLLQADKTVSVAVKAGDCERMCAAEGVIKMESFAPNLLWKVAASL